MESGPRRTLHCLMKGLRFPEGPRWRFGALWLSDIHDHRVLRVEADGKITEIVRLNDRPSGLGFLPDGTLLISSMLDRRLMAWKNHELHVHADLSSCCKAFINDMVVDREGRAYVGGRNGGPIGSPTDVVILVQPDGTCSVVAEDMTSPNGSAVTTDGAHLIVAEAQIGKLARFRIGPDGALTQRETISAPEGYIVDGICLDAEGAIWCGGGEVGAYRLSADGELLDEIHNPGRLTLAPALGGPHGKILYLATSAPKLIDNFKFIGNDRTRDAQVHADGRIETIEVAIPGVEAP